MMKVKYMTADTMNFNAEPVPEKKGRTRTVADYNRSVKGKTTKTKYQRDNSKWETDTSYLKRQFLAWDGEGITIADGSHLYVMLANSEGGYLADPAGLSTAACLSFILAEVQKYPGRINVIYGGGYDFNCWLADISKEDLDGVYRKKKWNLDGFTVAWQKGKAFYLTDKTTQVTIYDVVSFFQCAFVKACDDYLGDNFAHRDVIVENKALRSTFTSADIPTVKLYNEYELLNLIALMTELRSEEAHV